MTIPSAQHVTVTADGEILDTPKRSCRAVLHLVDVARWKRTVTHLYAACRRAMGLARQYRVEERVRGRKSRRLEAVMQQVALWREDVRFIRMARRQEQDPRQKGLFDDGA